jgi:hypothetical protein
MPVTRATSTDRGYTDDCRRAVYARGHAGHAELTQAESTPVYPPTLPMAPKRARLYSPRRYMLTAQASTRAYLALTVEDVFVFHAHAFNIALLLAVDPPTAQEAETKPGAQWEAPVQWLCQCLGVCHGASDISEPIRGVGSPQHLRGERTAAAPAPRALTRIGFITIPRKRLTRYRVILAHEAIACPGTSASAAAPPAQAA